jgi:hypothetical protein
MVVLGVAVKVTVDVEPEHIGDTALMVAVGLGLKVITTWSLTEVQDPAGSSVTIVRITLPDATVAALGVNVPEDFLP